VKLRQELFNILLIHDVHLLLWAYKPTYGVLQIAHFKIPRYVHFVDAFPLTISGKVQKFRMREMAVKMYKLSAAASA